MGKHIFLIALRRNSKDCFTVMVVDMKGITTNVRYEARTESKGFI